MYGIYMIFYPDIRKREILYVNGVGHGMLYQQAKYYPSIQIKYLFKFEIASSNLLFIFQLIVILNFFSQFEKFIFYAYFYLIN